MGTKKYKTIYADPPWEVMRGCDWGSGGKSNPLPYPTMPLDEIQQLPVKELADNNCHLYLWTINKYIRESYSIAEQWGFKVSCMITWCKPPHGIGLGGAFVQTTEHLLFCRRGSLKVNKRIDSTWFEHKRLKHSVKPELFRIMIESVSPPPRIELFARNWLPLFKCRPGWDVWGNEVECDINLEARAQKNNMEAGLQNTTAKGFNGEVI